MLHALFCSFKCYQYLLKVLVENAKNFPDITTLFSMMENGQIEPNFLFGFFNKKFEQHKAIDYEILNLLLNLPEETKIKLKGVIELIK